MLGDRACDSIGDDDPLLEPFTMMPSSKFSEIISGEGQALKYQRGHNTSTTTATETGSKPSFRSVTYVAQQSEEGALSVRWAQCLRNIVFGVLLR